MGVPAATYRVQFSPDFTFSELEDTLGYLSELGITDIYASPVFASRPGSRNGYDVTDPNLINPELGGREGFETLLGKVRDMGLGWVQDIVPNHMAFAGENPMLADVLENGECSPYIGFFDIDWSHPYESLRGRLLAPFLPALYGESLERGDITLEYSDHALRIKAPGCKFPLKIESYQTVLSCNLGSLEKSLGAEHPAFIRLKRIIDEIEGLDGGVTDKARRTESAASIKKMLGEAYEQDPEIRAHVDGNLKLFNGGGAPSDPYLPMDALLSSQLFRLSFWKVATEEINYRRFFNINGLIALKTEAATVFEDTHSEVLRLLSAGLITGLRVDHIDGLFDPGGYLERLRQAAPEAYIVVEKVLAMGEELPDGWPVEGTTGYDFLNHINALLCNTGNKRTFSRIYGAFAGAYETYEGAFYRSRKLIIEKHMTGDVDNLAHVFGRILSGDRHARDITHYGLRKAIVEILSNFPVYRTYIGGSPAAGRDRACILEAVDRARRLNPDFVYEIKRIGRFLLLEYPEHMREDDKNAWAESVRRFQQYTGALMAKGFEDTLLYKYNRLTSLNEVGGFPDRFGIRPGAFHEFIVRRTATAPRTMNATATHDAKRGEDARARISVLSELPRQWRLALKQWSEMNRKSRKAVGDRIMPDKSDEYFMYQTLLGTMPAGVCDHDEYVGRLKAYIIKSVREAKQHTAWIEPDTEYEDAYMAFIDDVMGLDTGLEFLDSFRPFLEKVAWYGTFNSLTQTLVKIAAPGVADFYQGTELWDLSFVDPDNRRPVDFKSREAMLGELKRRYAEDPAAIADELQTDYRDGRIKLFLVWRALSARLEDRALFADGDYLPLKVNGTRRNNIVAFARNLEDRWAVVVAPRLLAGVAAEGVRPTGAHVWGGTSVRMPSSYPRRWKNSITGEEVLLSADDTLEAGEALKNFPVCLLTGSARS